MSCPATYTPTFVAFASLAHYLRRRSFLRCPGNAGAKLCSSNHLVRNIHSLNEILVGGSVDQSLETSPYIQESDHHLPSSLFHLATFLGHARALQHPQALRLRLQSFQTGWRKDPYMVVYLFREMWIHLLHIHTLGLKSLSSNALKLVPLDLAPHFRRVIDQQMATLGIEAPTSTTAFLTEPTEEVEEDEASSSYDVHLKGRAGRWNNKTIMNRYYPSGIPLYHPAPGRHVFKKKKHIRSPMVPLTWHLSLGCRKRINCL